MFGPDAARYLEFSGTSVLIEITPGPNMAYLATLTLAKGVRSGCAAVAGVFSGLAVIGVLTGLGVATLIAEHPALYGTLRYAGVAFMFYLAWDGWVGRSDSESSVSDTRSAFFRGLITNLLNPKAALFYVAVLPLFISEGRDRQLDVASQTMILASIYVLVATIIHLGIVLCAYSLRPYLVEGPREIFVRRALSLMLAVVAVWFFWGTRR